jgi:hypothetical protein
MRKLVLILALVQTRGWRAMMKRCKRFVAIKDLFKGRHFDRQIIVLCVSWYTSFKLSLRDLVIMMADRGDLRDPYNDPAVGAALPSRIRKALVALRSTRRRIVEDGRDLYTRFTDNGCTCTALSTKRAKQPISF